MKKTLSVFTITAALTTLSHAAALYHYAFETANPTLNSGIGTATAVAQGSVTSGAGVGSSGSFAAFDGGNSSSSDAIDIDLSADLIPLNSFEISFFVNQVNHTNYDDYLSFATTGGALFTLETFDTGNLLLLNLGTGSGEVPSAIDTSDGTWRPIRIVGTAGINSADATIELFIDGNSIGTNQLTAGASQTITDLRIGGRVDADNRYSALGIDEVIIIPEPRSITLLSMTVLAFTIRRKR